MNYIPNQSNIRKEWGKEKPIRKIKGQETKKKSILCLMGKLVEPVNRVTRVNKSNLQTG